jgi:hypothetical protein
MKGFSFSGPPRAVKKASVANLNKVKSAVIQAGNRWGRQNAPEFFKNWREGNEALAVYSQSREIARFIGKHSKIRNPILKVMLGVHQYHHPIMGTALNLGKFAAQKGVEVATPMIFRFAKSKVLRDLYKTVIKEASKGNASATASAITKLEKHMDKEEIQ